MIPRCIAFSSQRSFQYKILASIKGRLLIFDVCERFYNDGVVPYDWLHANVCPIYKTGTGKAPVNYRPISLRPTCIACTIFEHIVTSSVVSHLDNQAILVDNQHGFRRGRSCETQLTEHTHAVPDQCCAGPVAYTVLSAGPLRCGLATFPTSTSARETVGAKKEIK